MEEKFLLNNILAFFVIFTIAATGISVAYADISAYQDNTPEEKIFLQLRSAGEWVSYTVGVGITWLSHPLIEAYAFVYEEPFETQKNGCTVVTDEDDRKRWECYGEWLSGDYKDPGGEERTPNEDGCANGLDIDIRTGECKPFEQINEEARLQYDIDPECPSGYYNPVETDPQTPDADSPYLTDQDLIKKINSILEDDANCYQGRGTTDGIQEMRDFPIPVTKIIKWVNGVKYITYELDLSTPSSAVQIRGYYAQIVKSAFECHAENTLMNPQGGILSSADAAFGFCDRYAETLTIEQSVQAGCGMTSGSYYRSLHADVPIMTQEMANQKANFGIEKAPLRQSNDYVCSHNYAESLRIAYGCPDLPKPESGNGKFTELQDYHDNVPGKNYEQYLKDDGKAAGEQALKDTINKKIANLVAEILKLRSQK